jgi:uncharacterized damage-inducible protein DinB
MPRVTEEEVARIMDHFEVSKTGGRCPQCDFDWSMSPADARALIETSPARTRQLIADRWDDARKQLDPPWWSPSAYVWHMADALGIWSERFVAMDADPDNELVGFDQDMLAEVRSYDRLSPKAALWAYERRARDFTESADLHDPGKTFVHPDFGPWTIGDVVRWMAHDMYHHEEDIRRQLSGPA